MPTLQFLGSAEAVVPPQVQEDLQKLSGIPVEPLEEMTVVCAQFLASHSKSEFLSGLDGVAEKYGMKLRALKAVTRSLLYYLRGAAKHSLSHSAVESDLKALTVEAGAAAAVAQAWRKQVGAVTEFTADSALDVNKIVDMEWKFGVTVASDEVEQVGSTFLQLKLFVDNGGKVEDVSMELTLTQFYDFLASMEKAQAYVELLAQTA